MRQSADGWNPTSLLVQEHDDARAADALSVLIFRLGTARVALPTQVCKEVAERGVIHTLPHRRTPILLGLVNIRGALHLCTSLRQFLGLEHAQAAGETEPHSPSQRLLVVESQGDIWVFPVDEIYGMQDVSTSAVQPVPVTTTNTIPRFARGYVTCEAHEVGCLDPELLFAALRREIV